MSRENQRQLFSALHRAVRLFIAGSSLYSQRVAEKLGMHPTDLQFLNLLDLMGPLTPGVLAQCSGLTTGGVTVVLDRLEKAGYIRRSSNPADRRSVLVGLVPAQRRRVTANYDAVDRQFEDLLATLSEEELQTVLKFLTRANELRPRAMQGRATNSD